ncbi:MAG: histone deacetylase [Thermoplasmata archaeon]|nr:histone deacetylase [Thermoplasmata archaeon]
MCPKWKTLIYAQPVQVDVTIFFNERFYDHIQTPFHPESPERLRGIVKMLRHHNLWRNVVASEIGDPSHLRLVHEENYIELIKNCDEGGLTMETAIHPDTFEIAALSAECGIDAAIHSRDKGVATFALTRPPGHHAGPDYGMGFCYFNNIAIAAEHLLNEGDEKIAIVDLDVHHGNGTEHAFKDRAEVLYVSTHQSGIFPGTGSVDFLGTGNGEGFTINLPFASGCGDSTYDVAYSEVVIPILRQFKPEAILISFGVDGHYRDPLASLSLSSDAHLRVAKELLKFSMQCGKRLTFFLEGGYDVPALSEVVAAIVGAINGVDVPLEYTDIIDNSCLGRGAIDRCTRNASEYWDL